MVQDIEDEGEVTPIESPIQNLTIKRRQPEKESRKDIKVSSRKGKDAHGFRPTSAANQFCFTKSLERFDARERALLLSAKLGDTTAKQREETIAEFRDDPTIKIVVAGFKCGGLGLNLSFANRVDVWWNVCIDNQAFGRVYRIGQNKGRYHVKIVLRNTVDARTILELQKKKEKGNL
ncbi:unnamed protein product [Diplocarpon coronariae]